MQQEDLKRAIRQGKGEEPADLVLKGGRFLDLVSGALVDSDIAITGDRITGTFGRYSGTREIDITGMYLVDDCGTVINPLLAEGQVHGGVAQGIAQALYEGMQYTAGTGQPVTGSLLDYLVPTAPDLPNYTAGRITTLCPNNPLGAKGIGESGAVGAPAAVVNAIVDALAPFGVEHVDMPVTPEKIWRILEEHTR